MSTKPEVEQTEFEFPDEKETKNKPVEAVEEDNVEVIDDTPEKDRGFKALDEEVTDPTEEELAQYSAAVRSRIDKLTHARHDERRRKEAVEREREEAFKLAQAVMQENKSLQEKLAKGESTFVTQTQQLVEVELEKAKKELKDAYEAGDVNAFVVAQTSLNEAQIKLDRVKNHKPARLTEEKETTTVAPTQAQRPPVAPVDAKAEAWKARNSWFGEDEEMTALALGLHNRLVRQGYDLQSDRYYDTVDATMRKRFPEAFKDAPKELEEKARRPATVVAPSSRSTPSNKVRLTQTQISIAKRLGVPLEKYAKQVAELDKQNG